MYVRFARLKKLLATTSPYEVRCEKIKLIAKNKMEYTFLRSTPVKLRSTCTMQ